jgi:hypothetical protein
MNVMYLEPVKPPAKMVKASSTSDIGSKANATNKTINQRQPLAPANKAPVASGGSNISHIYIGQVMVNIFAGNHFHT